LKKCIQKVTKFFPHQTIEREHAKVDIVAAQRTPGFPKNNNFRSQAKALACSLEDVEKGRNALELVRIRL
jgi:hypothetical protein